MIDTILFFLRAIRSAVRNPSPPLKTIPLIRRLLLLPVLYDISSALVQLKWLHYLDKSNTGILAIDNDKYYEKVQTYNASVTSRKSIAAGRRAEELLAALCLPPRSLKDERLLLIGPRTVQEFYLAWLYGFTWEKIEGIDLYRTHPQIHVMNMEAMTFPEASFDSILMSATLAYAKDVRTCLSECARVLRPGGHLVFGQTYCPGGEFRGNQVAGDETRGNLLALNLEPFYYRQIEKKINSLGLPQTYHVFGMRKPDGNPIFDSVHWGA